MGSRKGFNEGASKEFWLQKFPSSVMMAIAAIVLIERAAIPLGPRRSPRFRSLAGVHVDVRYGRRFACHKSGLMFFITPASCLVDIILFVVFVVRVVVVSSIERTIHLPRNPKQGSFVYRVTRNARAGPQSQYLDRVISILVR